VSYVDLYTHLPVIQTDRQPRLPQPFEQRFRFANRRDSPGPSRNCQQFHQATILLGLVDRAADFINEVVTIASQIDSGGSIDIELPHDVLRYLCCGLWP
jgi:hypothetical protein